MNNDRLDIEACLHVDAARDKVWRILTEPRYVAEWLGCLRYEKAVGHVFYMQQDDAKRANDVIDGATHCRIIELDAPAHFAFTWYLPGTPETEVHIELTAVGDGTEVRLRHVGWDQFDPGAIRAIRDALANGWTSFVLPGLKRIAENGP